MFDDRYKKFFEARNPELAAETEKLPQLYAQTMYLLVGFIQTEGDGPSVDGRSRKERAEILYEPCVTAWDRKERLRLACCSSLLRFTSASDGLV